MERRPAPGPSCPPQAAQAARAPSPPAAPAQPRPPDPEQRPRPPAPASHRAQRACRVPVPHGLAERARRGLWREAGRASTPSSARRPQTSAPKEAETGQSPPHPRTPLPSAPSAPAWAAASSRQEASLTPPALLSVRGPAPPLD